MTGRGHQSGIGFGGAVGLGVAAVLLIGVLAIGHAVLGQLQGAARVVVVFLEVALCVALGGLTLAVLGALWYFGGLARLHLAERQVQVGQLADGGRRFVTAEVLEDQAPEDQAPAALEDGPRRLPPSLAWPGIQRKQPRSFPGSPLYAVRDRDGRGPGGAS